MAALRNMFVSLLRDVRSILPHETLCVSIPCMSPMSRYAGTCCYMSPINADLQGGPGKVPLASFHDLVVFQ